METKKRNTGKKQGKKKKVIRKAIKKKKSVKVHKTSISSNYILTAVDMKVLELKLEFPGMTDNEIGAVVKRTGRQINSIRHKPIFIQEFKKYLDKAINIILKNKTRAGIKLIKHINSGDERVSLKACELVLGDILDPKKVVLEVHDKEQAKKSIEEIFE